MALYRLSKITKSGREPSGLSYTGLLILRLQIGKRVSSGTLWKVASVGWMRRLTDDQPPLRKGGRRQRRRPTPDQVAAGAPPAGAPRRSEKTDPTSEVKLETRL